MNWNDPILKNIVTYGTFYFPATAHYSRPCSVVCDRCKKTNIVACVGYKEYDLCMKCVDIVTNDLAEPIKDRDSEDDDRNPRHLVRMRSFRFDNETSRNNKDLTFMVSDKFFGK